MLWKVYFIGRAENGIPKSNHYKVDAYSPARALSEAVSFTEQSFKVRLIEIDSASVKIATKEEWDSEDGYEVLH